MPFADMANKPNPNPLPPKIAGLLRESWWLVLIAAAIFLVLVLHTYDPRDPGWSHTATHPEVQNAGGQFGAILADILLYVFGLSAYWVVAFLLYAIGWGYRRLDQVAHLDRRSFLVSFCGFSVLLLSSSALEALRFHSIRAALPLSPGGVIGDILGEAFSRTFGFTGATLLLLMLIAVGFSLFSGFSWLAFVEWFGGALEDSYFFILKSWEKWQDRRAGAVALTKREEFVEVEKKRFDSHQKIKIEPVAAEIQQSARVEREKQAPLFNDLPDSALPPLHLLDQPPKDIPVLSPETLEYISRLIERKLIDFGVEVKVVAAYPGPVITRYEIEPAVGVKGSQIVNLVKDLARALSVLSIRVVETIPGKSYMGLEIPNPKRQIVCLSEILSSRVYSDMTSPLCIAMGKDIAGKPMVADLARMPHVLVAGTTGSGKSVAINAMILSLIYKSTPEAVRLILVDPKMLELSVYEGIPHLLAPVVTDMKQAASALNWCVGEMERRYKLMAALGVRNLSGYNQKINEAKRAGEPLTNPFTLSPEHPEQLEPMPMIVVIIDELADLMMVVGKKVEELIARLAQKARASGVHLILATQRPSVDVITGLIKANIPTRVAFQVSSKIDSRTILDQMGAETLLGQGDMLYLPPGTGYPQRVHGAFVSDQEVHRVVDYLKQHGVADYVEGILESTVEGEEVEAGGGGDTESDPLYDEAVGIVLKTRRASISLVQRHLRIGYNRAARLIEQMEKSGLVSSMQSNGNREILVPSRTNE